jgi:uncharacterized protein YbcI
MQGWDENPGGVSLHTEIADAIARLTAEYTGRSPTNARTAIANDIITVLLEDTMTNGEQRLFDAGWGDLVLTKHRTSSR